MIGYQYMFFIFVCLSFFMVLPQLPPRTLFRKLLNSPGYIKSIRGRLGSLVLQCSILRTFRTLSASYFHVTSHQLAWSITKEYYSFSHLFATWLGSEVLLWHFLHRQLYHTEIFVPLSLWGNWWSGKMLNAQKSLGLTGLLKATCGSLCLSIAWPSRQVSDFRGMPSTSAECCMPNFCKRSRPNASFFPRYYAEEFAGCTAACYCTEAQN